MGMLFRLKEKNAHTIFGAIADELKKDGVELIEATPWLAPLMPQKRFSSRPETFRRTTGGCGIWFQASPRKFRGWKSARLVVVKNGAVLAVEGFEGTDKCLARGGELAGKDGGAVAVKVAKENHDMRFDIPCLGAQTLETCAAAQISVLAIESGKTLLLEREACAQLAKKNKISVTMLEHRHLTMNF